MDQDKQPTGYLTDEEYDYVYSRVPRLCVDVLLYSKGKGAVLSKRNINPFLGKLHIPGGRVRHHETTEQAINRIMDKEVGVKFSTPSLYHVLEFTNEWRMSNGNEIHSVSLLYTAEITKGEINDTDEGENNYYLDIPDKDNVIPRYHDFFVANWDKLSKLWN